MADENERKPRPIAWWYPDGKIRSRVTHRPAQVTALYDGPRQAGDPACPVVAHEWRYIGKDPYPKSLGGGLIARSKHELSAENPEYPDTWRHEHPLIRQSDHLAAMAAERAKCADALAQWTAIMNAVISELPLGVWAANHAAEHACGNPLPVAVREALAAKDARIAELEAQLGECQVGWETGARAIARNAELEADAEKLRAEAERVRIDAKAEAYSNPRFDHDWLSGEPAAPQWMLDAFSRQCFAMDKGALEWNEAKEKS